MKQAADMDEERAEELEHKRRKSEGERDGKGAAAAAAAAAGGGGAASATKAKPLFVATAAAGSAAAAATAGIAAAGSGQPASPGLRPAKGGRPEEAGRAASSDSPLPSPKLLPTVPSHGLPSYTTAAARRKTRSSTPPLCAVCGLAAPYTCIYCGTRFCCLTCQVYHMDTRWVGLGDGGATGVVAYTLQFSSLVGAHSLSAADRDRAVTSPSPAANIID